MPHAELSPATVLPGHVGSNDGFGVTAPRVVCQFSCGAASAVATKIILAEGHADVAIVYAFVLEDGEDNLRFMRDCEQWFGHPITVLRDQKYGASTFEVWRRKRFMSSFKGAPCSRELKRKVLDEFKRPSDVLVFGFDAEEQDRFDDFVERFPQFNCRAPLIERGLTKPDCLAMVQRAGLALPECYEHFNNANCRGRCPKAGEGHWNLMRVVRPAEFRQMLDAQESIGPGAYFFRDRKTDERFGLKDLRPDAGRHDEPMPACSFFCELAEQEYAP